MEPSHGHGQGVAPGCWLACGSIARDEKPIDRGGGDEIETVTGGKFTVALTYCTVTRLGNAAQGRACMH